MHTTDAPCTSRFEPFEPRRYLAATPTLLKDLNTANSFAPEAETIVEAGGTVFFVASDNLHGRELWRLDADDRMQLVADLVPGPDSSSPNELVELNETLYFFVELPSQGHLLMRSDGTAAGTLPVKALSRATHDWLEHRAVSFGDRLLFEERDSRRGTTKLYVSDGSAAATRTIVEGPASTNWRLDDSARLGDLLFFVGSDRDAQLWVTDGTRAGTRAIDLPHPGSPRSVYQLETFADSVYFAARHEHESKPDVHTMWRIDRDLQPHVVKTSDGPDDRYGYVSRIVAVDELLLFRVNQSTGYELWATDGTPDGATLLAADMPHYASPDYALWREHIYFAGRDGALWRTDGRTISIVQTAAALDGAELVEIITHDDAIYLLTETPDRHDDQNHVALWKTDGTTAGTTFIGNLRWGLALPEVRAAVGSRLVLGARYGSTIWLSDDAGVTPVPAPAVATQDSDPGMAVVVGDTTFFVARTADGTHLWRWRRGTTEPEIAHNFDLPIRALHPLGDRLIVYLRRPRKGCCPAMHALWSIGPTGPAVPLTQPADTGHLTYQIAGKTLFSQSSRHDRPPAIFRSDGTPEGTLAVPVRPDSETRAPGDRVFLSLYDEQFGQELWSVDADGARPVRDIAPGNLSSSPHIHATVGRNVFFNATDSDGRRELWTSDGTTAGTRPLTSSARPNKHLPHGVLWGTAALGKFFFTVVHPDGRSQLWTSDGTPAGTRALQRLHLRKGAPHLSGFVEVGGVAWFFSPRADGGIILSRTDGTREGTTRVRAFDAQRDRRFDPNEDDRLAAAPVLVKNRFYFALKSAGRYHVWSSDGTKAGTRALKRDISIRPQLFAAGDRLVFTASDPLHGHELWQSDGTRAGTALFADILPGPAGSSPYVLGLFNDRLLISAMDAEHGVEPWLITLDD